MTPSLTDKVGEGHSLPVLLHRAWALRGGLSSVRLAAASQGGVEQEGHVGKDGGDPHECKHLDSNVAADIELVLGRQGDLGGDADDCRDDGGDRDKDGCDGGEEG